jgi:PKD repeat protein
VSQNFDWIVNDSQVAVQVSPVSVQEGTGFALQATFTDTDVVDRQASDYTATVNWGDGNTDTLASFGGGSMYNPISGSAGQFTISDERAYLQPGSYPIQVTVMDPAGQSWVARATATVSAAPLTVTGGLVDDAVPGVSVTQTLASFTDANVDDAASSYTAMVNWGDGTQSAGVISGSNGDFVVSGTHEYAAQGNYTVTVTVTNAADQTSASATSTMDVGAIFAGQSASLQVASFTTSNPNAMASDFSATITWGDGTQSAGVVTESNGQFQVTGSHTYAADGNYAVQVTVTDQYGATLSTTGAVSVVRDPLSGYGNMVKANAGVALNNVLVGVYTDPDGGDQVGEYTATINWGDGTASSLGVVSGSCGLFEVCGSHTYATPGEYVPTVQVEWGDSMLVTSMVALLAVGDAPGVTGPRITGPLAVPDASEYQYVATIPPQLNIRQGDGHVVSWQVTSISGKVTASAAVPQYNAMGILTSVDTWVQFPSYLGDIVQLTVLEDGQVMKDIAPVKIYVIGVKVQPLITTSDPPKAPFVAGGPPVDYGTRKVPQTINGYKAPVWTKSVSSADFDNGKTAMTWSAVVKLNGVYGWVGDQYVLQGVNQITVGFVQYSAVSFWSVQLRNINTSITANIRDSKKYLDVALGEPGPYYEDSANAVADGAEAEDNEAVITANDTPQSIFPVLALGEVADRVAEQDTFTVDVAAATKSTANGANTQRALEATTSGLWVANTSGQIEGDSAATAKWVADPEQAGNRAPGTNSWYLRFPNPTMLNVSGPVFNEIVHSPTWTSRPDPK